MRYSSILFILILILSCSDKVKIKKVSSDFKADLKDEKSNRLTELIPEPDILVRLQGMKSKIDTLVTHEKLKLEVLAKEPAKETLTVVIDEQWSEVAETFFSIWRDPKGKIKLIGEYPFSESGDWTIAYLHYFDTNGKVFSFERNTNFYNSICTDGLANENIIEFYNSDFNRIDRIYSLTGKQNLELKKEDCVLNYDYPYEVSNNLENYLKSINYSHQIYED